MAKMGVKIVYCPSWWGYQDSDISFGYDQKAELKFVNITAQARAIESGMVLVYCNSAGEFAIGDYKDDLLGHSQINIPFSGVQRMLDHNREEMFIEEVDLGIVRDHERSYKIRADLKARY